MPVMPEGVSELEESLEPEAAIGRDVCRRWRWRWRRLAGGWAVISSPGRVAMDSRVGTGGGSSVSSGEKASRASKKGSDVESPSCSVSSMRGDVKQGRREDSRNKEMGIGRGSSSDQESLKKAAENTGLDKPAAHGIWERPDLRWKGQAKHDLTIIRY